MENTQQVTNQEQFINGQAGGDVAESVIRKIDRSTRKATGTSLLHILTIGSIGASIALFLSGKKKEGIFVGLWAPTFEALKSASQRNRQQS